MPAGRPTKYEEDFPQKTLEYIKQCKESGVIPKLEELAVEIFDVIPETISVYAKEYPEFSVAVEKLKAVQKNMLIDKGLNEVFNASMTKFVLSANHGMAETNNTNHGGQPKNPVLVMFGEQA